MTAAPCPTCGQLAPAPVEIVTVRVDVRLVSEANAHAHWRTRQARAKSQHHWVLAALAGMQPPTLRAVRDALDARALVVMLTRVGPRLLDDDDAAGSAKHVRDAVAAWLGVDDGPRGPVTWAYAQRRGKAGEYAVEIAFARRGGGNNA